MACLATEGPCNGIGGRVVCVSEDDVGVVPNGLQPLGELPRIVWLAFTEDEALPHQQRFPMLVHGGETTKVEPVLVASVGVVMDDQVVEAACRFHLFRRHPEEVGQLACFFVFFHLHDPPLVCLLAFLEALNKFTAIGRGLLPILVIDIFYILGL